MCTFTKTSACNFIKKEALAQVFSSWILRNFSEHLFLQNTSGGYFCNQEIKIPKPVFKSNGYPKNLINLCIKTILDKVFVQNWVNLTVPTSVLVEIQGNRFIIWEQVWSTQLRKIYYFINLRLFLDLLPGLVIYLDSKIPLRKESSVEYHLPLYL